MESILSFVSMSTCYFTLFLLNLNIQLLTSIQKCCKQIYCWLCMYVTFIITVIMTIHMATIYWGIYLHIQHHIHHYQNHQKEILRQNRNTKIYCHEYYSLLSCATIRRSLVGCFLLQVLIGIWDWARDSKKKKQIKNNSNSADGNKMLE